MNPSSRSIVQFGAGNIGRSLVGQLFSRAGYEVVFVDAVAEIVDALNARGRYQIRVKDTRAPATAETIWVEHVRGLHASDTEGIARAVRQASLISTAVGAGALPKIFPALAAGLLGRDAPVSILFCENLRGAAVLAREALAKHLPAGFDLTGRVGLVETSIGKMVPLMPREVRERDPLEVWAEAYNQIVADREGFVGPPPAVDGLVLKDHFAAYVDRKLFIHNLGHAAAGYHGFLAGKTYVWECMENPDLRAEIRGAMEEAARALSRRYPQAFDETNQRAHIEDLLERFANRALGDTVYRVGRDLARKLAPGDRCLGALRLVTAEGLPAAHILRTIAAALCFDAADHEGRRLPQDEALRLRVRESGPRAVLTEVCALDPAQDRELIEAIVRAYRGLA